MEIDYTQFWEWVNEQRNKRGWSFRAMGKAAGNEARGGSFQKAYDQKYRPSSEMYRDIARAFSMDVLDVMKIAGDIDKVPREYISADRPMLKKWLEIGIHMTDEEIDRTIRVQEALKKG